MHNNRTKSKLLGMTYSCVWDYCLPALLINYMAFYSPATLKCSNFPLAAVPVHILLLLPGHPLPLLPSTHYNLSFENHFSFFSPQEYLLQSPTFRCQYGLGAVRGDSMTFSCCTVMVALFPSLFLD